ncbi:hypothetical protein V6615_16135 [Oscillospiraceae bacterium PP1C4]
MICASCSQEVQSKFCPYCGEQAPWSIGIESIHEKFEVPSGFGFRCRVTAVELTNGQFEATNYYSDKSSKVITKTLFTKNNIASVYYKRMPIITKTDIVRYIVAIFMCFLPSFCLGLLVALFTYFYSLSKGILIELHSGQKVRIYYKNEQDMGRLYELLAGC